MKSQALVFIAILLLCATLPLQAASTKDELNALNAKIDAMQKDLNEIKTLLKNTARTPAAPSAVTRFKAQTVNMSDSPYKGKADAPVTLMEFSDYQCPYCARNYRDVMPSLIKEYVDTGKLKFVMREKPIASLHRNAIEASMAALCAKDQGKYWEMHNVMFDNQRALNADNLKAYAADLGMNSQDFDQCLDSEKYADQIDDDIVLATSLGISGTPGFILGFTDASNPDNAEMSKFIKGAQPLAVFRQAIDELLETGG